MSFKLLVPGLAIEQFWYTCHPNNNLPISFTLLFGRVCFRRDMPRSQNRNKRPSCKEVLCMEPRKGWDKQMVLRFHTSENIREVQGLRKTSCDSFFDSPINNEAWSNSARALFWIILLLHRLPPVRGMRPFLEVLRRFDWETWRGKVDS